MAGRMCRAAHVASTAPTSSAHARHDIGSAKNLCFVHKRVLRGQQMARCRLGGSNGRIAQLSAY